MQHITVLQHEAVSALQVTPGDVVVDCTLGSGGHSREIADIISPNGHLIAFDADPAAIARNTSLGETLNLKVTLVNKNFSQLGAVLSSLDVSSVNGILADLGWRIEQFNGTEGEKRGFSFSSDEPLLMTYGDPETYVFTAKDIVNEWDESSIADIIYGYGEERAARKIARAIVAARAEGEITTARQLADIVASTLSFPRLRLHPATKTFQALRIAVNDELGVLKHLLDTAVSVLAPKGRLAVITFHSLEDRVVKHAFRSFAHDQRGVVITKKPITPSAAELTDNPRARSAKLRIFESI